MYNFRKTFFIGLMILIVIGISVCVYSVINPLLNPKPTSQDTNNENLYNNNNNNYYNNVDNKSQKTYTFNEPLTITNSKGKYTVTITNIYETSDRNRFSDIIANKVILIEYSYENIDMTDDLYISDSQFKVYDKDNNILEDYPATEEKYSGSISTGRKGTASVAFALNNPNNYVEIEFYGSYSANKSDAKFILEW